MTALALYGCFRFVFSGYSCAKAADFAIKIVNSSDFSMAYDFNALYLRLNCLRIICSTTMAAEVVIRTQPMLMHM